MCEKQQPVVSVLLVVAGVLFCGSVLQAADVPSFATDRADAWFLRYQIWTAVHYGLGLVSVVLSVTSVAYKSASRATKSTLVLLAALATGVLTFLNPSPNAKAFHRAWQQLDTTILKHRQSEESGTTDLINSIENGEKILIE